MKFCLFILIMTSTFTVYSKDSSPILPDNQAPTEQTDEVGKGRTFPFIFTLAYRNGLTKINHNETSASSGYTPLGTTNSMTSNSGEIGLIKEIFPAHRLSFSLIGNYGIDSGKKSGTATILSYSEKLSGTHYSFGGNLNLNFGNSFMRIQPFVSYSITKGTSTNSLNYSATAGNTNPTTIQYKSTLQETEVGFGTRVIDLETQMISFLAINYNLQNNNTITATSTVNNVSSQLITTSKVELRPWSLILGIGFYF